MEAMTVSEHADQVALFRWADLQRTRYPALRMMFAVPNGGARHKATAGKLKAEGVKAGVPDVFLPVPSHGYHGLVIELKRAKTPGKPAGKVSESQKWWLGELAAVGYCTGLAYGWEQARALIEEYLAL